MASPVLVVDDSRVMRRIIIRALNDIGLNEVVEANDGDEALAEFAKYAKEKWNINVKTSALAAGTVGGVLLGTSTVSSYIESITGIAQGARTGVRRPERQLPHARGA